MIVLGASQSLRAKCLMRCSGYSVRAPGGIFYRGSIQTTKRFTGAVGNGLRPKCCAMCLPILPTPCASKEGLMNRNATSTLRLRRPGAVAMRLAQHGVEQT